MLASKAGCSSSAGIADARLIASELPAGLSTRPTFCHFLPWSQVQDWQHLDALVGIPLRHCRSTICFGPGWKMIQDKCDALFFQASTILGMMMGAEHSPVR